MLGVSHDVADEPVEKQLVATSERSTAKIKIKKVKFIMHYRGMWFRKREGRKQGDMAVCRVFGYGGAEYDEASERNHMTMPPFSSGERLAGWWANAMTPDPVTAPDSSSKLS